MQYHKFGLNVHVDYFSNRVFGSIAYSLAIAFQIVLLPLNQIFRKKPDKSFVYRVPFPQGYTLQYAGLPKQASPIILQRFQAHFQKHLIPLNAGYAEYPALKPLLPPLAHVLN